MKLQDQPFDRPDPRAALPLRDQPPGHRDSGANCLKAGRKRPGHADANFYQEKGQEAVLGLRRCSDEDPPDLLLHRGQP